jgi:hypothetical protein
MIIFVIHQGEIGALNTRSKLLGLMDEDSLTPRLNWDRSTSQALDEADPSPSCSLDLG